MKEIINCKTLIAIYITICSNYKANVFFIFFFETNISKFLFLALSRLYIEALIKSKRHLFGGEEEEGEYRSLLLILAEYVAVIIFALAAREGRACIATYCIYASRFSQSTARRNR